MEKYFYIPVNSLNFNNILSSESLSPSSFYEKRGYGFKRFEKITLNPFNNSILAYNTIPLIEELKSDREEFPIYLAIPNDYLEDVKNNYKKESILILQISQTLYLNPFECFFITKSKEEKLKLIASSRRSLEVKSADKYFENFATIEELNFKTFNWNSKTLDSVFDIKSIDTASLLNDQKINKFKGLLYGYLSGRLNEQPEEIIKAKFYYQEFINNFSLLMNDLSTGINGKKNNSKYNQNNNKITFDKLNDLKERISILLDTFENDKIENIVLDSFNLSTEILEGISKMTYKKSKKSILSILIDFIKNKEPELNSVEELLNILLYKSNELTRYSNSKLYRELEDDFNTVRLLISQKINSIENSFNSKKSLSLIPFKVNNDFTRVNVGLEELAPNENSCFEVIINELLCRTELSSSDEIAQSRLDIITQVGKAIVVSNVELKDSAEIKYLRKLYESLKTIGIGFKINESENLSLQAFACFLNRYSDNEKLLDFMVKNGVSNNGLVYGIWGTAYGYANLSKIITEPMSQNNDVYKLTCNYFNNLIYNKNLEFNILKNFIDSHEKTEPKLIKPYSINNTNHFLKEPIEKSINNIEFIDLVIENKKLKLNDEWIETIKDCFEKVSKEINTDLLFDSENAKISLFKDLLKSKKMKGFGEVKLEETIKIYIHFLKSNE
nr:hypothetical protein [uncultured Flavobacterium sp.]